MLISAENSNENHSYTEKASLYALHARAALSNKDYTNAEKYALKTLEMPDATLPMDLILAHIVLGFVYANDNDVKKARKEIQNAEKISGVPHGFDCVLSRILLSSGQNTEAAALAEKTLHNITEYERKRAYGCYYTLGWAAWQRADKKGAIINFKQFLYTLELVPHIGATAHRNAVEIKKILQTSNE